jgi:hypothetical protein
VGQCNCYPWEVVHAVDCPLNPLPEAEALMLDGPASGAPDAVDVRSTESTPLESTGASPALPSPASPPGKEPVT